MGSEKELKIKISAESFEIKNIEIKNGRLELILSAMIDTTEVEESTFDHEVSTGNFVTKDNIAELPILDQAPTSIRASDAARQPILEEVVDTQKSEQSISEDLRYGEPDRDIEWEAVNTENIEETGREVSFEEELTPIQEEPDDLIVEPTSSHQDEQPTINSSSSVKTPIVTESDDEEQPQEQSSQEPVLPSYKKVVISTNEEEAQDTLPDYLVQAKTAKIEPATKINTEEDSICRKQADNPTVIMERTPSTVKPEESSPEITDDITEKNERAHTEPKMQPKQTDQTVVPVVVKKVRFNCPRCHTVGSQTISSIGSIITCSNCGRALKLNVKK